MLHRAALLLPAAASALRPASLDDVGIATSTRGDRSLGRQLATKAVVQGEASGPSAQPLRPRLLLWQRRPDADDEGGRTKIRCMLQAYISNVS